MKRCKLLLATLAATVLLGTLVSSVSARNISVSTQQLRSTYSSLEFHFPELTTRCHLTLEGSLHARTFAKVIGSLIGYITSAILGPCLSGTATILRETLPWHVKYSGFEGRLPEIRSIIFHVINASWRIRDGGGLNCLARSSATEPAIQRIHVDASGHETNGIEGTIRTGVECFGIAGSFRSDSPRINALGTITPISVRLI